MTSLNIMQQQIEANEQRLLMDEQQQDTKSGDESIMQPGEGLEIETTGKDRRLSHPILTPPHAIGYW